MTPYVRRMFDLYCELREDHSASGIPIYPDKVTLPEWSEYDKGILASCRIAP